MLSGTTIYKVELMLYKIQFETHHKSTNKNIYWGYKTSEKLNFVTDV